MAITSKLSTHSNSLFKTASPGRDIQGLKN